MHTNTDIKPINVLHFMKNFTEIQTLRISKIQKETLFKMKSRNVDIARFIRSAIREKIKRDYKELMPKHPKITYPF